MLLKDESNFHYVRCPICDVHTEGYFLEEGALEVWNTRAPSTGELHWKNNHDCQVARSKILIDRLDMPVERVKAYQYICELELRVALLEKQLGIKQ